MFAGDIFGLAPQSSQSDAAAAAGAGDAPSFKPADAAGLLLLLLLTPPTLLLLLITPSVWLAGFFAASARVSERETSGV